MLSIFTRLADWIVYGLCGMEQGNHWAASLHFFIEDTTKIFVLLVVMIYVIALFRASLNTEKVRDYLAKRNRFAGYFAGALFGAVTPFCSCSSIPLFLSFTTARIPIGITMAFLITSPMINEAAIVLLGGILGIKFTLLYVAVGIGAGIVGGIFFDFIKAEKYLMPLVKQVANNAACGCGGSCSIDGDVPVKLTFAARHKFAFDELKEIVGRIWKWIFIGVGAGALLHGFVPSDFILDNLGSGQWWSVPAAVLIGIPLYANATGVIPVIETLLNKGLPIGTAVAFMMSIVAASFPEFMLLKQVMKTKMLVIFFVLLLVLFTFTGWIFNIIF